MWIISGKSIDLLLTYRAASNYTEGRLNEIRALIVAADFDKAGKVFKGDFKFPVEELEKRVPGATMVLKKLYESHELEKRQQFSDRVDKRTRVLEDICDWEDLVEFIGYYCYCGGMSPSLGVFIPLKWLAVDRNTDVDGRYGVSSSFFSFKWENSGAGAVGNAFTTKAGLERERVRLGLQQETDDRLIKTAALKEYYTVVIAFLNSRVDIRDYSERMLYYSSKLVGDLPYYKAFVEHRRKNPPPPFVPLPSYNTVNDGKIQVSLQGKEEWLPIGNDGNLPAVKDLLQIRLDRRLVPTNADSASIIGRYGHGTVWACEKRYLDGALMLLRCNYLVEESHLLGLQKATKGVGPKVTGAIKKFLNPEVELDDDDDEVELREEREEFGENDSNVVDEEDEVEQ